MPILSVGVRWGRAIGWVCKSEAAGSNPARSISRKSSFAAASPIGFHIGQQRCEHGAGIYLLIAGTYTPVRLLVLSGAWRLVLLAIVWTGATAAIALEFVWVAAPKWLAAVIGLALGWVGVAALPQLASRLNPAAVVLLGTAESPTPPVRSSTRGAGQTQHQPCSATTSSSTRSPSWRLPASTSQSLSSSFALDSRRRGYPTFSCTRGVCVRSTPLSSEAFDRHSGRRPSVGFMRVGCTNSARRDKWRNCRQDRICAPLRLLHARLRDGNGEPAPRDSEPERGGDPARAGGQPLPLHRLPQHRPRRAGGGRRRGGVTMASPTQIQLGQIVGTPVDRKEDMALLTGQAKYVDDMSVPGMVWMSVVRSPYAHARSGGVDVSGALAHSGAIAAFSGEKLADEWQASLPCAWLPTEDTNQPNHRPLAVDEARYVGDGVAERNGLVRKATGRSTSGHVCRR